MTASTARIIRLTPWNRPATDGRPSLPLRHARFRHDRDLGPLQLGPAAGADSVVQLDDLAAAGALAAQLVSLGAVQDGGDEPADRHQPGDQEPQQEGRPLRPRDDAAGEGEGKAENQVRHSGGIEPTCGPVTAEVDEASGIRTSARPERLTSEDDEASGIRTSARRTLFRGHPCPRVPAWI